MKDTYITAVLEECAAGKDPDVIFSGLQATLKRRGHTRLYESILRGVARVLEARRTENVTVTVARSADYEQLQSAIAQTLAELGATETPIVRFDDTIIGGYIAEANNRRLDASYKAKLVTLYRSLTK